MTYLYLHGFASSPHSLKAQYFRDRFAQNDLSLMIPDLNQGDFFHLSLTRQLQQVAAQLDDTQTPVTLMGSSLGGLTAAWVGEKYPQVEQLILLAPAFGFLPYWLEKLGKEEVRQWQETGELLVYHYGEKRSLPLSYQFVHDISQYDDHTLKRPISTLILHGKQDEIVPIESSCRYARQRPWVELIELDSDHGLTGVMDELWTVIFSKISP